jgi:hypothetical protein
VVIEKRPWSNGARSPWAGEEEAPTVLQVACAYPGRAFGAAVIAAVAGSFVFVPAFWAFSWAVRPVIGVDLFNSFASVIVWLLFVAAVWWGNLHGEIRGWWTWEYGGD